ncbi:MAG: hypothetical protein HUU35_15715, partial [Armatimonadetes bacterium]|nr:hypothetical protein [Armatimonadota bacterium]
GIGRAVRLTRDEVAPGWRPLALALNLPLILGLVGLPGYFVYDRIGAFWHENIIPAGPFLQAAATVLLLWLALGMLVGQGLVRRRTRRFLGSLREMVAQAVDEVLRPRLLERLDEHHAELRDEQQVLARWATEFGARR